MFDLVWRPSDWPRGLVVACVAAATVAALAFGLDGFPTLADAVHKDEQFFVQPAVRMVAQGSLDPQWFGHPGSTTIYPIAAFIKVRAMEVSTPTLSQLREWGYPMGRVLSL